MRRSSSQRLRGFAAGVGPGYTGCGECVNICPVGAACITEGLAHIGESRKGYGRCASVCPVRAFEFQLAGDADALGWLLGRSQERTGIGRLLGGEMAP